MLLTALTAFLTTVAATAATSIYGGGGADTINISSGALNLTQINGNGAGLHPLAGSADGVITTFNSVNSGAGADTISVGTQINGFSAIGVGTINGGAGSDLVIIQAASGVTASSMAGSTLTGLTNLGFVIAGAGTGDVVRIGNNAAVTTGIPAQLTGQLQPPKSTSTTALSTFSADQATGAGSVSVFSDGTDSLITISSNAGGTSLFTIFVDGKDLTGTSLLATF